MEAKVLTILDTARGVSDGIRTLAVPNLRFVLTKRYALDASLIIVCNQMPEAVHRHGVNFNPLVS